MGNYFTAAIVESLTFQNNKRQKRFGELYTKKMYITMMLYYTYKKVYLYMFTSKCIKYTRARMCSIRGKELIVTVVAVFIVHSFMPTHAACGGGSFLQTGCLTTV